MLPLFGSFHFTSLHSALHLPPHHTHKPQSSHFFLKIQDVQFPEGWAWWWWAKREDETKRNQPMSFYPSTEYSKQNQASQAAPPPFPVSVFEPFVCCPFFSPQPVSYPVSCRVSGCQGLYLQPCTLSVIVRYLLEAYTFCLSPTSFLLQPSLSMKVWSTYSGAQRREG